MFYWRATLENQKYYPTVEFDSLNSILPMLSIK